MAFVQMLKCYLGSKPFARDDDERGQGMVEYTMIIGSITIILVAAFIITPTLSTPIQALPGRIVAFITPGS